MSTKVSTSGPKCRRPVRYVISLVFSCVLILFVIFHNVFRTKPTLDSSAMSFSPPPAVYTCSPVEITESSGTCCSFVYAYVNFLGCDRIFAHMVQLRTRVRAFVAWRQSHLTLAITRGGFIGDLTKWHKSQISSSLAVPPRVQT